MQNTPAGGPGNQGSSPSAPGGNQGSQNNNSGQRSLSWQAPAAPGSGGPGKPPMTPIDKSKNTVPPKKVNDTKSSRGGYIGIFIAGLIVGVLVGWGIMSMRGTGSNSPVASSTPTNTSSSSASSGSNSSSNSNSNSGGSIALPSNAGDTPFSIATQDPGLVVAVSNVAVAQPTWIVIYEDNNGTLGRALGAHLFFPKAQGGATSGTIDLLRGTLPGQKYFAGQSLDDGDHIFSTQNDKPVRDSKGNPVVMQFATK